MKIFVLAKDQYGQIAFHPNCGRAEAFARLAGTKTLTKPALQQIKQLGYEVVVQHPTIQL